MKTILTTISIIAATSVQAATTNYCIDLTGEYKGRVTGFQPARRPNIAPVNMESHIRVHQTATELKITDLLLNDVQVYPLNKMEDRSSSLPTVDRPIRSVSAVCYGDEIVVTIAQTTTDLNSPLNSHSVMRLSRNVAGGFTEVSTMTGPQGLFSVMTSHLSSVRY